MFKDQLHNVMRMRSPGGWGAATRAGLMAGLLGLLMLRSSATADPLLAFDFENPPGTTAAASFSDGVISGGVFAGSNNASAASGTRYRSGGLFPANANGSFFNFFTFTTASSLQLSSLEFKAFHNDTSVGVDRNFDVLLSPVNPAAPPTNAGGSAGRRNILDGDAVPAGQDPYALLATVAVPDNVLTPFNIDLTGNGLTPGTYDIAFAVAPGAGGVTGNIRVAGGGPDVAVRFVAATANMPGFVPGTAADGAPTGRRERPDPFSVPLETGKINAKENYNES